MKDETKDQEKKSTKAVPIQEFIEEYPIFRQEPRPKPTMNFTVAPALSVWDPYDCM